MAPIKARFFQEDFCPVFSENLGFMLPICWPPVRLSQSQTSRLSARTKRPYSENELCQTWLMPLGPSFPFSFLAFIGLQREGRLRIRCSARKEREPPGQHGRAFWHCNLSFHDLAMLESRGHPGSKSKRVSKKVFGGSTENTRESANRALVIML